ncbi:MAG: head GIN domain-containing protein [Lutibacter sp.]
MKKIIYLLVLATTITYAQNPIEKKLGDFSTLKVFNGLTVVLHQSSAASIKITGKKADEVSVKNSNGILKLRLKFPESFNADDVAITVNYVNEIPVLDANEGSTIKSDETLNQQHLEVKVQEGAKIKVPVEVKYLVVKAVSGGIIKLSGATQNQTIEATTGAIYKAFDLQSKQTTVLAASGARVDVKTSEVLDAKVRFGGTINYKGTPEVLKTKKIIGGTIRNKN